MEKIINELTASIKSKISFLLKKKKYKYTNSELNEVDFILKEDDMYKYLHEGHDETYWRPVGVIDNLTGYPATFIPLEQLIKTRDEYNDVIKHYDELVLYELLDLEKIVNEKCDEFLSEI